MKPLFAFICLFFLTGLYGQRPADLKNMSLSGDVKKRIRYHYSNIKLRNHNWEPKDTSEWHLKEVEEFDKDGNIDREVQIYRSEAANRTLITQYQQLDNTTTSRTWDNKGSLTFTARVTWKNRQSCESYFVDSAGRFTLVSKHFNLDSNNSKATAEVRTFDKDSVFLAGFNSEYFLENNLVTREIRTDLKNKEVQDSYYDYTKFDRSGNPAELHISPQKHKKPTEIIVTKYEYY